MAISVYPVTENFAAEIGDLDLARPLDPADLAAIKGAFATYAVLIFPDQQLTQEQHLAFAARFGPLELTIAVHRKDAPLRVRKEFADVSNLNHKDKVWREDSRTRQFQLANRIWHTDSSFKRLPARASLLYARTIPPVGGHTEFADERAAYDALPEAMKRRLEGLVAEHSIFNSRGRLGFSNFSEEERQSLPPVPQALVRVIAESGRKSLYLASHAGRIFGMPEAVGRALIDLGAAAGAISSPLVWTKPSAGERIMVIDCHGHYTTAPRQLEVFRQNQIAGWKDASRAPASASLDIRDEEIRESLQLQLTFQRERGTDLTIFSPRAAGMGHHIGDAAVSLAWSEICNDLIHRCCTLYPDNFVAVCQLPQSPGVPPKHCVAELERCVKSLGFVGCNLNPDPSGGHWTDPPLTDRWWYPLHEKLVELDVPAMIHVSASDNPNFHATGAHYLNADTTAFMQFLTSDLFKDFPNLRFVIPHGGGAVPYHWGRYRGLAQDMKRPPFAELLLRNVFFDTCVYHLPGIELLLKVVPADNILFASEMVGAVRGIDPETGHYFDDTKRYIDAVAWLGEEAKRKIFSENARKVYRLDRRAASPASPR